MRHSIVRRSTGVTIVYLVGHAFNYALILVANRILDAGGFSLFYATTLAMTVAISPVIAATFVITRVFADVGVKHGQTQVAALTGRLVALTLRWGVPAAAVCGLALAIIAPLLGLQAWAVLLIFPAAVLALIVFEILRASFQSLLLFTWSSAIWFVCQAAQCVLAAAALVVFGKVWTGVAGIFAGAALTCALFVPWFTRQVAAAREPAAPGFSWSMIIFRKPVPAFRDHALGTIDFAHELRMILSYSLFVLMNNVDILVGYWWLSPGASDVYAASSLLPKAIVTATFPVAQVVLPVIVDRRSSGLLFRHSILKAIALVGAMSIAAAVALWLGAPIYQKTAIAIRGLDFPLLLLLAVGAVALSTWRVLVVVEVAVGEFFLGIAQLVPIALFVAICLVVEPSASHLALAYTGVSWGFLACAFMFALARTASRRPGRSESAEG
jgi:hypothetical protein